MTQWIKISEIGKVYDGPHATPKKTNIGPVYLGIDAITNDGKLNPSQYSYLADEDYLKWTKRVTPQKDDIVFSYEATLGRYAMIPEDFYGCLGRRLAIVRVNDNKINPKWLFYYFQSPQWSAFIDNHIVRGSTVDRISVDDYPSYKIPLLERSKQDEIVAILSALDDKIDVNVKICSELEEMAKLIYDYWFVQFDFPDENGNPYRTSGGAMEWNDQLKREIPKGWSAGNLQQVGMIVSGGTPSTKREDYYTKEGVAWITPNDLSKNKGNLFIDHGERDITKKGLDNSSATLMPKGSVLLSSRAPIGYLAIAMNEISTNQGFKSIVPKYGYHEYYIYYLLKSSVHAITQQGAGTTFKEVSKDMLSDFMFALPPVELAAKFVQTIKSMCDKRQVIELENKELTKLRDWLLPMLMNGQVTVE